MIAALLLPKARISLTNTRRAPVPSHRLVIDTLTPMDGTRKAFRLIGGILVERTIADVLPDVDSNHKNVQQMIEVLGKRLSEFEKEASDWQKKYQIRTPQEQQQLQAQQAQQAAAGGGSAGVLA